MGEVSKKEIKMIRVSISGAQSVGKTTLINELFKVPFIQEHFILKHNTTRNALNAGLNINQRGDDTTQLVILNQHLANYITPCSTIYDRCTLDGYVYTTWLEQQNKVSMRIQRLARALFEMAKYDLMFYLPPEDHVPLKNDGERSTSKEWQQEIHRLFEVVIKHELLPRQVYHKHRIIEVTGTLEERTEKVFDTIYSEIMVLT